MENAQMHGTLHVLNVEKLLRGMSTKIIMSVWQRCRNIRESSWQKRGKRRQTGKRRTRVRRKSQIPIQMKNQLKRRLSQNPTLRNLFRQKSKRKTSISVTTTHSLAGEKQQSLSWSQKEKPWSRKNCLRKSGKFIRKVVNMPICPWISKIGIIKVLKMSLWKYSIKKRISKSRVKAKKLR